MSPNKRIIIQKARKILSCNIAAAIFILYGIWLVYLLVRWAAAAVISFGWSYGGALAEAIVERDIWRSGMIVR